MFPYLIDKKVDFLGVTSLSNLICILFLLAIVGKSAAETAVGAKSRAAIAPSRIFFVMFISRKCLADAWLVEFMLCFW